MIYFNFTQTKPHVILFWIEWFFDSKPIQTVQRTSLCICVCILIVRSKKKNIFIF